MVTSNQLMLHQLAHKTNHHSTQQLTSIQMSVTQSYQNKKWHRMEAEVYQSRQYYHKELQTQSLIHTNRKRNFVVASQIVIRATMLWATSSSTTIITRVMEVELVVRWQ